MTDRVVLNTPDNWLGPDLELGAVDEIVLSGSLVHIESMNSAGAYIGIVHSSGQSFTGRIHARATTRVERRQLLRHDQEQLVDQLRRLLPYRWSRTSWSVPLWRRPAAAWQTWRDAAYRARAVLLITVDEDSEIDGDFTGPTGGER